METKLFLLISYYIFSLAVMTCHAVEGKEPIPVRIFLLVIAPLTFPVMLGTAMFKILSSDIKRAENL